MYRSIILLCVATGSAPAGADVFPYDHLDALAVEEGLRLEPQVRERAILGGRAGRRLSARAEHAGYPVWGAGVRVFLDSEGEVAFERVRPHPPLPALDTPPPEGDGELMWREVDGQWRLVRMVEIPDLPEGRVEVRDPWTGAVLDAWPWALTGTAAAQVYEFSPEDGEMIDVDLVRLHDTDCLGGDYLWIIGLTDAGYTESYCQEGSGYYFGTEDDAFAGVMAYYHLEYARDRALDLDPDLALDHLGYVYVNYPDWPNAAFAYDSASNTVYFMFGDEYRYSIYTLYDYTYEANVMHHEFGHYVLYQITDFSDTYALGEMYFQSIHEGWADYRATTVTEHPIIGEYVWQQFEEYQRDIRTDHAHPDDYDARGDSHENGRIWGSMAWDIREAAGAEVADALTYASMHYVEGDSYDFELSISGMLQADADLYDHRYSALVLREAQAHGLEPYEGMDSDRPSTEVDVRSWFGESAHTPVRLQARTSDDDEVISYYWRIDDAPVESQPTIPNPFARQAEFYPDGEGEYTVELYVMDEEWGLSDGKAVTFVVEATEEAGVGCNSAGGAGAWLAGLLALGARRRRRQRNPR